MRESFIPSRLKSSIALCASNSPQSTIIIPTDPYQQTTSSSRNLKTVYLVLFAEARPSTRFVRSSLASSKHFIYPNPISIESKSTIHLKCMVSGYVGRNLSRRRNALGSFRMWTRNVVHLCTCLATNTSPSTFPTSPMSLYDLPKHSHGIQTSVSFDRLS